MVSATTLLSHRHWNPLWSRILRMKCYWTPLEKSLKLRTMAAWSTSHSCTKTGIAESWYRRQKTALTGTYKINTHGDCTSRQVVGNHLSLLRGLTPLRSILMAFWCIKPTQLSFSSIEKHTAWLSNLKTFLQVRQSHLLAKGQIKLNSY